MLGNGQEIILMEMVLCFFLMEPGIREIGRKINFMVKDK
jgi:hypothetical protein